MSIFMLGEEGARNVDLIRGETLRRIIMVPDIFLFILTVVVVLFAIVVITSVMIWLDIGPLSLVYCINSAEVTCSADAIHWALEYVAVVLATLIASKIYWVAAWHRYRRSVRRFNEKHPTAASRIPGDL